MTDDELKNILRSAFPRVEAQEPSRDLWPSIVGRVETRTSWSMLDLYIVAAVIAATAAALAMVPQDVLLLASHL